MSSLRPRLLPSAMKNGRDRLGLAVGLGGVLVAVGLDASVPGRAFPLTAVLLGPVLAAALAGPGRVGVVGAVALTAATWRAGDEQLAGSESWTRLLLVTLVVLAACAVALVRARQEQALVRAHRTAAQSLALQRRLLPSLHSTEQVAVRTRYQPSSEHLVVGGDFIDVIAFPAAGPGAVAFCVGDVTGHDGAAAGLSAALRAGWRTLALAGGDPVSWLHALDDLVLAETRGHDDDKLATACVGVLDPASRCLVVASAGHPRPLLLSPGTSGAHVVDVDAGPPLGLPRGLGDGWTSDAVGLDPQGALLLYTDGLVEGRRVPGSPYRYGEEALTAWFNSELAAPRVDDARLDRLLNDVTAANGEPLHDDIAIVVLAHRTPVTTPAAPDRATRPPAQATPVLPAPAEKLSSPTASRKRPRPYCGAGEQLLAGVAGRRLRTEEPGRAPGGG